MRYFLASVLSTLLLIPAARAADPQYTTWWVPWEDTRPRDPDVGPDGDVWFVGQTGDYVGVFNPAQQTYRRYELAPGTGPHNLIVADNGMVWYAGNRAAHIGRLDPADGSIEKIPMPDPQARDPHTLRFDGRGNIWFTVQGGNFVGRLDRETEKVRLWPVPTANALPYGIVVSPGGRPWIAELGTHRLGTIDLEKMAYREVPLPREQARPRRIAMTEDGRVWYVDYAEGYLGVYDPQSGEFSEWRSPAGEDARPYGMAVDARGRIWYAETGPQPNRLIGFDPASERFFSNTQIPDTRGAVRNMDFYNGMLWFGTDTNYLVRARLPAPAGKVKKGQD